MRRLRGVEVDAPAASETPPEGERKKPVEAGAKQEIDTAKAEGADVATPAAEASEEGDDE